MFTRYRESRSVLVILLVSLFSISMIVGCGQNESTNAESENAKTGVAIQVGSESISQSEFSKRINDQLERFKQNPRFKQQLGRLPEQQRQQQLNRMKSRLKRRLAQRLETKLLLDHHIKQAGITVSEDEVQTRLDEAKKNQPQLQKMLEQQGKSMESLEDRIREQLKIQKFIDEKVGTIEVSEEEARQYYKENQSEFNKPERVKARHILISDTSQTGKQKVADLKTQIDEGADFAELAKEESQGPSAKRGGSLNYITRDQMAKPFSDAAFSLGVGEVSGPVKTQFGWHLIKVEDRKEATETTYDDVADTIVQQVQQQQKQQKFRQVLRKLRQETEIVNNISTGRPARSRGRGQGRRPRSPQQ